MKTNYLFKKHLDQICSYTLDLLNILQETYKLRQHINFGQTITELNILFTRLRLEANGPILTKLIILVSEKYSQIVGPNFFSFEIFTKILFNVLFSSYLN